MDQTKRLVLFIVISTVFFFTWSVMFPPPRQPVRPAGADSATATTNAPVAVPTRPAPAAAPAAEGVPARLVRVRSPLYEYRFSTAGAALDAATLLRFESYVQRDGSVQLVPRNSRNVLAQRVVVGADTIDFRRVAF